MADYSQHQGPNPEWQEFTKITVVPAVGLGPGETPEEYRLSRNALREKVSRKELEQSGLLEFVFWQDFEVPTRDHSTLPARVYKPKSVGSISAAPKLLPVYFFFHGGGYLFGSIDSEDANCARVIAQSSSPLIVVHVNYRHTPAFKHPTQHNDAWDSFLWLDENIVSLGGDPNKVVIGGISAGGGLAASVVLRAQERKASFNMKVVGQMLIIPWVVHPKAYPFGLLISKEKSSYSQNMEAPNLPMTQIDMFVDILDSEQTCPDDIYLSPLLTPDEKIKGMPKALIVAAGMDPLRDEALLYAEKLKKNGIPTDVHIFPGLPHGFRRFESLKASARWDEVIQQGFQWCLSDNSISSERVEKP